MQLLAKGTAVGVQVYESLSSIPNEVGSLRYRVHFRQDECPFTLDIRWSNTRGQTEGLVSSTTLRSDEHRGAVSSVAWG
jgi:hypothetical protein